MPYRFIETIAIADVAFEATGSSLEELLLAAWEATLKTMIRNPEDIEMRISKTICVTQNHCDMLLHDFLQNLIFFKDAQGALFRVMSLTLTKGDENYEIDAQLSGESIDPSRHQMIVDVKAVTFYHLAVEEKRKGWRATVVLDV
jgi:SHS2 domain-containing protein